MIGKERILYEFSKLFVEIELLTNENVSITNKKKLNKKKKNVLDNRCKEYMRTNSEIYNFMRKIAKDYSVDEEKEYLELIENLKKEFGEEINSFKERINNTKKIREKREKINNTKKIREKREKINNTKKIRDEKKFKSVNKIINNLVRKDKEDD